MKKTKIICTMGPNTDDEEMMRKLAKAGMDVARFNFSHGDHEEQKTRMDLLKKVRKELKLPIAILLDTKGPEIRTGILEGGQKVYLEEGSQFTLTTEQIEGNNIRCSQTYKNLPKDVKVGDTILIDDGLIQLTVENVTDTDVVCRVVNGGELGQKKGINVPNVEVKLPAITEQDKNDILFGIEQDIDFIAASFVRNAEAIKEIKELLRANGGERIDVIAKIENAEGVHNIDKIIKAADGVMVARGDLGVEVPLEDVPVLQKRMIRRAEQMGKICVTATQMLDSMMHNPRPTRAETTDVANAIYDGTTAIMLSGESANGAYPEESVRTMAAIAVRAEADIDYASRMNSRSVVDRGDITTAISHASCTVAEDIKADAIITVTLSGFTARRLAAHKPVCPIIACTTSKETACQMNLLFGVEPVIIRQEPTADLLFEEAINTAKLAGYVKPGDKVVLTAGIPLGVSGKTNMIRVIEVW